MLLAGWPARSFLSVFEVVADVSHQPRDVRLDAVARARISLGWQSQFVMLAAIWGSSFLFIKVLDKHWSALWVAFGRIALGALVLALLMLIRRERYPSDRRVWLHCAVAAVFFNALPWTLFAFGEHHASSIVAGLWNATAPIWVLLITLIAFAEESPTRARAIGLVVGFIGVATLLGPWRGLGSGALIGHLACAAAAVCYGLGFPYTRRHLAGRAESGVVLSACQLLCATVMLAVFLPLAAPPTLHIGLDGVGSLLALGGLGSGVAFAINYNIVRARGATVASTVGYLIPVFSTVLGAVILGETLHWNQPVGTVVLLTGIATAQGAMPAIHRAIRRRDAPVHPTVSPSERRPAAVRRG
jgi:drug/metabolite transporter (DMT)-like permease